jgi:hypothetical protein
MSGIKETCTILFCDAVLGDLPCRRFVVLRTMDSIWARSQAHAHHGWSSTFHEGDRTKPIYDYCDEHTEPEP